MREKRPLFLVASVVFVICVLVVKPGSSHGTCGGGGGEDVAEDGGGGSCGGGPPEGGSCGGGPPEGGSCGGGGGGPPEGGSCGGGGGPPEGGSCGGGGGGPPEGGSCGGPPQDEQGSCGGGGGSPPSGGSCGGPPPGGAGTCGGGGGGGNDGSEDNQGMTVPRSMESKIKLRRMLKKIDTNKDGKISLEELQDWTDKQSYKIVETQGKKHMKDYDSDGDGYVTWEEYADYMQIGKSDTEEEKKNVKTQKRRFAMADKDQDEKLTAYELGKMAAPEESAEMADVVYQEYVEGYDKDDDGLISEEEYIGSDTPDDGKPMDKETRDSVTMQFKEEDKDKSGKLDKQEIVDMIVLANEAKVLMDYIDTDKDGFITEVEVFKKYARFALSRATMYGELIKEDKKKKIETKQEESVKEDESSKKKDEL